MAVAYDNSLTAKNGTNNTTWASGNLLFGTLTNPAVFLLFVWDNTSGTARTVSSMQFDPAGQNVAMNLFNGGTSSWGAGRGEAGCALYYLTGSGATLDAANHSVTATMSGNTRWKAGLLLSAQGVDQTTPLAGFVSDTTDTTSPSALSPTGGTANDLLIADRFQFDGSGTATMGASTNTTQRGTTQTDTSVFGLEFLGGTAPGNASTIGFTWSAAVGACLDIAAVIKAVSGGGFTAKQRRTNVQTGTRVGVRQIIQGKVLVPCW